MPVRLREIYLRLEHGPAELLAEAAGLLGVSRGEISELAVLRRAVDARRKPAIRFVYTVLVTLSDPAAEPRSAARAPGGRAEFVPAPREEPEPPCGKERLGGPVLVVGAGPAGLFAALRLAERGYAPVVLERGRGVEARGEDVRAFLDEGLLDRESNVVFGEGGAGAFSDGKLTHRARSGEAGEVLRVLAACGAPEDVTYEAKPHVGSDILPGVVARLRRRIERAGGTFRFGARAAAFRTNGGGALRLVLQEASGRDELAPGALVLAGGSSAHDTWRALAEAGVALEARPTLVGVRVEHPQGTIDRAQYGPAAGHERLGPAEYFLKHSPGAGRGCSDDARPVHSFCMCPGGRVIPVASGGGGLSTNGMSLRARDSGFADAALVAPVGPADYGGSSPLSGAEFLERLEREAFAAGGGDYSLPCQRLADFLRGEGSGSLPDCPPLVRRRNARVDRLLPPELVESVRRAAAVFARRVEGFAGPEAAVYGAELRVSSPVRITRTREGVSPSAPDLYPAGEGAGYAGGIVSSAVDGLRQAARIVRRFAPPGG